MDYIKLLEEELNTNYKINSNVQVDEGYIIGAGDSYAAGLVVQGKKKGKVFVLDPYEALDFNFDKPVVILSVSGKTKYNVLLARKLRNKTRVIAVTANLDSPLAKESKEVVELPYKPKARLPGFLSFLMSLSALYSIFGLEEDKGGAKGFDIETNPFFVGKGENYGVAYFASLKMAEIFGEPSSYESLELFVHAPIFTTRNRQIIIFSSGDDREKKLKDMIDYTKVISTDCEGAFCNTKSLLYSIILKMKRENWNRIYFLEDEKILNISSEMIY